LKAKFEKRLKQLVKLCLIFNLHKYEQTYENKRLLNEIYSDFGTVIRRMKNRKLLEIFTKTHFTLDSRSTIILYQVSFY